MHETLRSRQVCKLPLLSLCPLSMMPTTLWEFAVGLLLSQGVWSSGPDLWKDGFHILVGDSSQNRTTTSTWKPQVQENNGKDQDVAVACCKVSRP